METITLTQEYLDEIEFEENIEDYILEMDIQSYSSNTLRTYKSILTNFYNFLLKQKKVNSQKAILRSFKKYLQYLMRNIY